MTRGRIGSRGWILLLGCASGLSGFGMASLVPALPVLATALDANFGAVQFVVSVYLFTLGLVQPVHGVLCDRYGRRPVLLAGVAVFALGGAAAAIAPTLPWVIAARFLQALGGSVGTVVARAMVRDTHEPERAAVALSFITVVMGLAPILSPIAGGYLVEAVDWRAIFALHVAAGLALLAWAVVALPETWPASDHATSGPTLAQASAVLLRDRRFLGFTFIYGCSNGIIFAFLTIGAALFERLFGIGPARFGLLWALLAAAFSAGAWLAGTGMRRFGSARILRVGVGGTLAGAALFTLAALWPQPSLALYLIALIALVAGNGAVSPIALAGAVSDHPELAGLASGLSGSLAMLSTVLFGVSAGVLYSGTSGTITVLVVAGAAGVALAARATSALRSARR
ncbi:MAG: Bcr/CflA family efflux MFS transporter [Steroidobacteraceae bacterium]